MGFLNWLKSIGRCLEGQASQRYVTVSSSGKVHVRASTPAEAKLAMKELRLMRKMLFIKKRAITSQQ